MKKIAKVSPSIASVGAWSRGANFITHCNAEAHANLTQLLDGRPVDACVWRSDVVASLEGDRTAATVFGNWLSVMNIDQAFSLRSEIDGPIPVMLLRHFVEPGWVESEVDLAKLAATSAVHPLDLRADTKSFASEVEADEAAANRVHLRQVHRHRLLTGLCEAFMRRLKSMRSDRSDSASINDVSAMEAFDACLGICNRVAAMYPASLWPDNASGPEPAAAQLARTVANAIADQIRAQRDASSLC